jgi:uncharacterized protein (TIGR02118 family)
MDRRSAVATIGMGLGLGLAASAAGAETARPSKGIKFVVLYGHPPNPAEFEQYYLDVHMPLVEAIRGANGMQAAKCLPQADGSPPPFHRIFEMWFDSPEHMAEVFATPEGMKARADVANFTEGTSMLRFVCEL